MRRHRISNVVNGIQKADFIMIINRGKAMICKSYCILTIVYAYHLLNLLPQSKTIMPKILFLFSHAYIFENNINL